MPKDPFTGTPNTKIANSARSDEARPTRDDIGNLFANRNSNLVIGVERKLAIDPVSFSRTTATADMMAGIRISISMMTLGPSRKRS